MEIPEYLPEHGLGQRAIPGYLPEESNYSGSKPTLHNGTTSTVQYHYPLISVGDKATAAQYALTDSAGCLNYIFFYLVLI